ncbi:MAG: hypothetical protein HOE11_01720 [Candidatus Diapherotrites archaeon]|jgi:chorismate mutase|nr:hypothetical protein [Candidatus Diapherotrites archaeon]MBT4596355.1 hypothetical protein [Candidatus Diapherotrites archaeon]
MKIDLNELRIKIDQLNTGVISGLKHRSRFLTNDGVFDSDFANGQTWFLYRLQKEQDIDAQFGRFLYFDQHPFIFKKEELTKPLVERIVPESPINYISVDLSERIIRIYQDVVKAICAKGEDETQYGEVVKLDVNNVLLFNERTVGIGGQVAQYKLQDNPKLSELGSAKEIKEILFRKEREDQVINDMKEKAEQLGIKYPSAIGVFAKELIDITMETEIKYILEQKND